ncbi:unnamed protein product [Candidula unifasciata]|uniref:SCA7 domain-containing protein n=1 Tax=Candidula unifasciata TaxID=100452 RepID=A0A8S3YS75_9EUPU|nr:unnamed protein product [Candidula unifasciata]
MATQDRSPSLIIGQQWSALAELASPGAENGAVCVDKVEKNNSNDSYTMKLGRQDMGLFGFCPSRDEFSLVVCEKCNLLVKPQALKRHIESRHGPTNLSSLGNIPASALNTELGKKLLMPLQKQCLASSKVTTPSDRQMSGTFKPVSSGWLPTKASLKQVPASVKNVAAPVLGVCMKISPLKSVKSGNRITPPTTTAATTTTTPTSKSTTATTAAASTASSSVVKVDKLEKTSSVSTLSSLSSKPETKTEGSSAPSEISKSVLNPDSSRISTLVNGSIKSVVSLTTPSATTTTNSPSLVSTPMLIAVTKPLTSTTLSTKCITTFVNTVSLTKPVMIAPVTAVSCAGAMAVRPVSATKSSKSPREQKERKFLPCKDREYDANKHCGVVISETGKQCTRSLTCKTHTLTLRRAVSGRRKSFDDLLKEHKAAKDVLLRAKAESQNAAAASSAATSTNCIQLSPAAISSTLVHAAAVAGAPRTVMPSSTISPAATTVMKPHPVSNVFQRFTSTAVLPAAITVKEETAAQQDLLTKLPQPFPEVSSDAKCHQNFLSHHPKPIANAQFAGRLHDRGCFLFSRKMDYIRAALLSALERHLNPPPHKKLCVESNLPQECQVLSTSQDPYEFNMVDTSQGAAFALSNSLINATKTTTKPKSKLPTSPVSASAPEPPSLCISSGAVATPLSLSTSSFSTLCVAPVVVSSAPSASFALNWPVKSREILTSRSPSAYPSPVLSSAPVTNPGKRKRSGSNTGSSNHLMAVASGNGALPLTPAISVSVSPANIAPGTVQQTSLTGIMTPTSLNSHHTGNLIAIPSVSLGQLNAATLGTAKFTTAASGTSTTSAIKNNIFKDFNLVLTGVDPSLMNGQYVNITGAQLAELAAHQGQTFFLNSLPPGGANSSTHALGNPSSLNLPTSRSAKRSRNSGLKFHQTLSNSAKLTASTLEGLKLIPSSGVLTSSAVLVDSNSLQSAMLTSVALGTGGTTPALVAINPSTANSDPAAGIPTQVSSLVCHLPLGGANSSTHAVGIPSSLNHPTSRSAKRKNSNSQHHHLHPSSSKAHPHHHHHHQHNKAPQQQSIALGSVLQTSPSIAVPIQSGSAAQLCSSQAIFKPGGTFSLATKTVGGKLTMQPVSLTFPISINQAGLAALTSGKPPQQQQQQQQHPQHTLLVTTSAGGGDVDSAGV